MQLDENLKKDLFYYMVRWLAFGAVAGLFTPVAPHDAMTESFVLGTKLQHLLIGLLFGAACGYAFTLFQNGFNAKRNRKVTFSIAAALWLGFNIAFAGIAML